MRPVEGAADRDIRRHPVPAGARWSYSLSFTFSALGPFGPCAFSKVTAWPSRSESNGVPEHADWWKKYSLESPARIKPKPLSLTSR